MAGMAPEPPPSLRRLLQEAGPFLGTAPDLADLAPLLVPRLDAVAGAFYDSIRQSPRARRFVGDEEAFRRLHASLVAWLEAFLQTDPRMELRAGMALRMARAHARIGMPLDLTLLGHARLRQLLLAELLDAWAGDRPGLADASDRLTRALDLDAVLLVSAYHSVALDRERTAGERLAQVNLRLQEVVRAQEMLLRTTSHELRTPLTGLLGLLNLLRRGTYRDAEARARVEEDIYGAARHLLTLVDDLLALSRIEVGKALLEPQDHDALELARSVARRFAPRFAEAGLSLEVRTAGPGSVRVHADPERHAQVLSNLLQNALEHTSRGGVTVELAPLPGAGHVLVRVRDTGAGLPPELLSRLFEPFAQGRGRSRGLGLGLAICRRLVLRMGGRIRARSPGPGQGTTFEFTLPAAGRQAPGTERSGDPAAPVRVLLVDDDAVWRRDLADLLAKELPVQVVAVADAETALEVAGAEPLDLILLDVALADRKGGRFQDGLDLLQSLACDAATMLVPRWLVTAHDPGFLGPELAAGWHDAFWNKARIEAAPGDFLTAIRRLLAGRVALSA